jgi:hypothetical protein
MEELDFKIIFKKAISDGGWKRKLRTEGTV